MGESHTRGAQVHRPVTPEIAGGQPAMTRASNGLPFKPYAYRGEKEPPAVVAARERHRCLNAEIERAQDEAAQRRRERSEALAGPDPDGGTP